MIINTLRINPDGTQEIVQQELPSDWFPAIEEIRAAKIAELDAANEQTIFAGLDITTSFGTLHYPLRDRDQADLTFFNQLIMAGAAGWLYNAEGQSHVFYPIADLTIIVNTSSFYITQCRTYFSTLREWVMRETDIEVINGITYGDELPADLADAFNAKMAMLAGGGS